MGRGFAAAVAALGLGAPTAQANSLYSGRGPRPGPDLLYERPATPPQLEHTGIWRADPILVSGATAYRNGEFLYQDFLYDDHGANSGIAVYNRDPSDPRHATHFASQPNGTYFYPRDPAYGDNAADFVELRTKALSDATAFRVTLNTMKDPSLIAFTIAIGGNPNVAVPFPYGANVRAPADLFLTVHPSGSGMTADLLQAGTGTPSPGQSPTVSVDQGRRQIEVRVPHAAWDPGGGVVRLAAGVGLWDKAAGRYLIPGYAADRTHPGGGGNLGTNSAFFNVAFRGDEPLPRVNDLPGTANDPAWWRDSLQGAALRQGDISALHADVDFGKLAAGTNDDGGVAKSGPMNRILASRFESGQGVDYTTDCFGTAAGGGRSEDCPGVLRGRLQPYAIYVPRKPVPRAGFGLTLLMHGALASHNEFAGSRHEAQVGERGPGSIVISPEGRGPVGFYTGYAAADVFEAWADVARRYQLNADWTSIAGYSMGGIGTFKFAQMFPDLFARANPIVGFEGVPYRLASLRNIPVLMWNGSADELVNPNSYLPTIQELDRLQYEYEADIFHPGEHFSFALNDQFQPAANFLGTQEVDRNPFHLTFVVDPALYHRKLDFVADHAYWLSGLAVKGTDTDHGTVDAVSHGFGRRDGAPSETQRGTGTLTGGRLLDPYPYNRQYRTVGPPSQAAEANVLDLTVRKISAATVDVPRARLRCSPRLNVDTDGPIAIRLGGCGRVVRLGCINSRGPARGRRLGPARLGRTRARQRRLLGGKALASRRGMDRYCVKGGGALRIGYPTARLWRRQRAAAKGQAIVIRTSSERFSVRGVRPGTTVRRLHRRLRGERRVQVGRNVWYLARGRRATLIFKVRRRRVLEVGLANRRLTRTSRASRRFLRTWELPRRRSSRRRGR